MPLITSLIAANEDAGKKVKRPTKRVLRELILLASSRKNAIKALLAAALKECLREGGNRVNYNPQAFGVIADNLRIFDEVFRILVVAGRANPGESNFRVIDRENCLDSGRKIICLFGWRNVKVSALHEGKAISQVDSEI